MIKKEEKLIKKIINKNEKALYDFYQANKQALYNFIFRQVKNREDAEEILQDSFLAFVEALRDFRGQSSLKTFLFSIARKKIIDKFRKKKIKKILFSALPAPLVNSLTTILIDEELEKKELKKKIGRVLAELPNDYRLVLRLKYIEGEKVKNIAKRISLGFKATESLIFRARKAFIKIFNNI